MTAFRERLRLELEQRNVSILTLARETGIGRPYIYDILRGKSAPSIPLADRIAEYFGLSLADMIAS